MLLRAMTAFAMVIGVMSAGCSSPKQQGEPPRRIWGLPIEEATGPSAGNELAAKGDADAGYPRFADTYGGVVVFSAEEDLWEVAATGGIARRLTTHPGVELFAKFSPDGKWLAFSGDYDGNQDVFVMPSAGGVPQRLTWHPSQDQVLGWTPDGKSILFRSRRDHPHVDWTLYTVPLEGGDAVHLPIDRGARLAYEPGGKRVAINVLEADFRYWKRYAGGSTPQILVGDLDGGMFRKLTTFLGTNSFPMWHEGRIYFLSDRTGTLNLWSVTPEGTALKQHTRFDDYDVRFPSLNQGKIVFQHRAELYLLDLKTDEQKPIPIHIVSDCQAARTRFTDPSQYLSRFELSPDGRTLGLEIRGDLHLVPTAKEGRRIQITHGSASRERGIEFSDDGSEIAANSDAPGETEVTVYDAQGAKPPRQVTTDGTRFKYPPAWAPGGKLLAYGDSDNKLYIVPAKGGESKEVDHSPYGRISGYSFSPDGRWIAYTKVGENDFRSVFLYDIQKEKVVPITDFTANDWSPAWSTDGKYLAFLSERALDPVLDNLDQETIIDRATKPYLVLLSAKTRSPFLPAKIGEREEPKKDKDKDKDESDDQKKAKARVTIDVEGIADRIVEVPVAAGHYNALWAGSGALLYLSEPALGMAEWEKLLWAGDKPSSTLMRFDFKEKKADTFLEDVTSYAVSRDGKKVAVRRKKGSLYAFKLAAKGPKDDELKEAEIQLAPIRESVEPRAEWQQIFDESWRMMRDLYFAPDMGKVDWPAMHKKYAVLLPRIATRDELEDLIGEMVGELSLGHTYVWGGDKQRGKRVPVGLLGADLEPDSHANHYRFKRIFEGVSWDSDRSSPLTLGYAQVKEGEYLIKIDGRELHPGDEVYSRLQKAAGEVVQLTVSEDPTGAGARELEITTLKDEYPVRYDSWVRHNRQYVARKTDGKVGYLHIPDMMSAGMVEFDRWYYPQVRKQGLIIDARWNHGGFVSQMMIKRLSRHVLSWRKSRSGFVGPYPDNAVHGKIVVLTNERAGSDGDIFPRAIQVAKIGPVIGTRTWGGVVGINMQLPLVDEGTSTRPGFAAWWEQERKWGVEGEGVQPDIVVDNDPAETFRGADAQLDKGISVVLELLAKDPPQPPAFGDYPDKRKETWVKRYGQTDKP